MKLGSDVFAASRTDSVPVSRMYPSQVFAPPMLESSRSRRPPSRHPGVSRHGSEDSRAPVSGPRIPAPRSRRLLGFRLWAVLLVAGLLAACHPPVRLMPAPAAFTAGERSPFAANPLLERTNRVRIFYATNRLPAGPRASRVYTILPGQSLYLGTATVRIGSRDKDWEALYELSTNPSEGRRPTLRLDALEEQAMIRAGAAPDRIPPEARRFFDSINEALARSLDKDLTIYVHGSNTSIDTGAAQAAQFRHFTGRNSVVLLFAWPSAGSGLRYFTDVRHARLTVPVFQRMLQLLARHTTAEHIDVLAYSAGAQILSPALAALARPGPGDVDARLGEVYFAAPDIAFPTFAAQLPRYINRARRVTVSANLNDTVLGISQRFHGVSRLGRPDPSELSEDRSRWLIEASTRMNFDLISVQPEVIPGMRRGAHAFWYDHPWVSSDVMIKFLFHVPPAVRGLASNWTPRQFQYWTFPADYGARVGGIIRELYNTRFGTAKTKTEVSPPEPRPEPPVPH